MNQWKCEVWNKLLLCVILSTLWGINVSQGVDVVGESGASAQCESFTARRPLKVFKDPTLFLPNLGLILEDPKVGWYRLMQETPLLTTLSGPVRLQRLGEPREFKNFGVIARLYELVEPRLRLIEPDEAVPGRAVRIVPVQVCGEGNLGFVLEQDWIDAQKADPSNHSLPPSTRGNPVPEWAEGPFG